MTTATNTSTPAPSTDPAWAGLVWTLVRTDFKARYHGTGSGFLWALLKPTAMFVVLVAVFSLIFRSEPNYKLKLIIGLFLWDYFADSTKAGLASMSSKSFLITRARLPTWILVVTSLANAIVTLTVFASIVVAYLLATGAFPGLPALIAFGGYLAALVTITVGISLGASVLFLRYRDLNQVWDMAMQAGFFVSPIIYPLSVVPERFHFWLFFWPPTPVIEFTRAALLGPTLPTTTANVYLGLLSTGILIAGAMVYRRFGPRAAEYL